MPSGYQPLNQVTDKDEISFISHQALSTEIAMKKGVFYFFLALTVFNLALAVSIAYHSHALAQSLGRYEYQEISSLPQIDPFSGDYVIGSPVSRIHDKSNVSGLCQS
ncbi:hypothetical protein GALMADRAFT_1354869 [Galerina marginata CBS 339.88]|uniref:Uncharacterized protein n=1 Tax=Galerina marginata (strain CBS 339.88) TaxID=685588 RepID=A0A067SDJ8_GALM3|nr:hypothetical protein GALMADRAFT_1354869 [Galerina marginata CBS 339.88]